MHTTTDGAVATRGSPSRVCRAGNGSWSSLGGGAARATVPSCEVCLPPLETQWSGLLDGTVMAWGGPYDRPVGGGVSVAQWTKSV